MNMHFNPILQGLFLGVGHTPPPRLYIESDPPALNAVLRTRKILASWIRIRKIIFFQCGSLALNCLNKKNILPYKTLVSYHFIINIPRTCKGCIHHAAGFCC